jgi:hypothetical protein
MIILQGIGLGGPELLILIVIVAFAIAVPIILYKFGIERGRKLAILHIEYQEALKNGDKTIALQAGRSYYSSMRRGNITPDDEQSLKKALEQMK